MAINKPNYQHSIVNLAASIAHACGYSPINTTPLSILPPANLKLKTNIVLVVVDGLGYRYLLEKANERGLKQHLKDSLTSVFPSTTASAITSFVTAQCPKTHGATGWFMFLKELGTVAALLPFASRYGGASLLQAGITPYDIIGVPSLFNQLDRRAVVISPQHLIPSAFSEYAYQGAENIGYHDLTAFFEQITMTINRAREPQFVYAYWPEFDGLCHQHGIGSDVVFEHYLALEAKFDTLFDAVQHSDSTIIITADHGLIDTSIAQTVYVKDHPVLASCLSLPLCGEPRVAYCYVKVKHQQTFERYVSNELAEYCELHKTSDFIDAGYLGDGCAHPLLDDRLGDYVLLMKDHFIIKDQLLGERIFQTIGVHGGLTEDELLVPFIRVDSSS